MIPFNATTLFGDEIYLLQKACKNGLLSGNGYYTKLCCDFLKDNLQSQEVLLTSSCTAALEMAAILLDLQPKDEVIMPSFTFVSTANAFVLHGATPIFVDIKSQTLNINENLIEDAITPRTKAIVVVHYAGNSCNMDIIMKLAKKYNLPVIEDAAQAIGAKYKGKPLGSIGDIGCFSFHATKNVSAGEGGAISINNSTYIDRARVIHEKGTNRSQFLRGQADKYTWIDVGSSFLPSELTAALLFGQLQHLNEITKCRLETWETYHQHFTTASKGFDIKLPVLEPFASHNGHIYHLRFGSEKYRNQFIEFMARRHIQCTFHYIPLHSSPFGTKFVEENGTLEETTRAASSLVRLPIWLGMKKQQHEVINAAQHFIDALGKTYKEPKD